MLTLDAVAFVFRKSLDYRAVGAGNFPRLFNGLTFMFEPEGAAMTNGKLEAILFEEVIKAGNLSLIHI